MTLDIKYFYYGPTMARYKYMKLALTCIPNEIIDQYSLCTLSSDGWVYLDIRKGILGFKQSGRIANGRIKSHLAHFGFAPVPITPALWKHTTKPIIFSLVIDDFGVKYIGKENANQIIQYLQKLYTIYINWTGSLLCRLTIYWDYTACTCNISMPKYLQTALHKFQHPAPKRPQHAPHSWEKPTYGSHVKYAPDDNSYPLFPAKTINLMQKIVGTLLYYSIAVNPTMLTALCSITAQQAKGTEKTYVDTLWLLNYAATHPNATIRYTASDMILHIHSDTIYLSKPRSRSRAGGHYFLGYKRPKATHHPSAPQWPHPLHLPNHVKRNGFGRQSQYRSRLHQ